MSRLLRSGRSLFCKPRSPLRTFKEGYKDVLTSSELFQEETLPHYKAENLYPVRPGQVFRDQYQILGKLGYGGSSTVWFARDLVEHRYVAVKVCGSRRSRDSDVTEGELAAYSRLRSLRLPSPSQGLQIGATRIRKLHDHFEMRGPHGRHSCLVYEPLHMSLGQFQRMLANTILSEPMLKGLLRIVFQALDFLHRGANIIHTDVKPGNIMLDIRDETLLEAMEKDFLANAGPMKTLYDRTIYASRHLGHPRSNAWGMPVLCDLGEAEIGEGQDPASFQPAPYRAPEVQLEMPWSYPVDIWMVGCMVWNLFYDRFLFEDDPSEDYMSATYHMAQTHAYMGPPPQDFLQKSQLSEICWDKDGKWVNTVVSLPDISLEAAETRLEGENKRLFLDFIRSMLQWRPEDRKTAEQLLEDPWLNSQVEYAQDLQSGEDW